MLSQFVSPKAASDITKSINAKAASDLPCGYAQDFADALRGRINDIPGRMIPRDDPNAPGPAIDLNDYAFIDFDPKTPKPDTIHPSLWRQAQLNSISGLFEVCEGIYQFRGYDLANMTIIETANGLVVIDPLSVVETARAAMKLYQYCRPYKTKIFAVMFTHSHADHFGGIGGLFPNGQPDACVKIVAPEGFLHHAVSENVFAGNAMSRRAQYMYGEFLDRSAHGHVDAGLGKALAKGDYSFLSPNITVSKRRKRMVFDEMEFEFQMANGTEAPSEMLIYIPHYYALCGAEVVNHTMHNLYTLRGAEIRDAAEWWKTIHETIDLFSHRTKVLFFTHHWPIWDQPKVESFLANQRDMYKFLHDQTLRLMNHGMGSVDIADTIKLHPNLAKEWYNHGYYGTVSHNVRGIYQRYLGYYSSNPADLNPLPPVKAAERYVRYMGGSKTVTDLARESFKDGDYRWVATVLNHVLQAEPSYDAARELLADTFIQLGYQSEAATWRNEYLSAAHELRCGLTPVEPKKNDMVNFMTFEMLFDFLGIRLNGSDAKDVDILIEFDFLYPLPDGEPLKVVATVRNSCLIYSMSTIAIGKAFRDDRSNFGAQAKARLDKSTFVDLFFGQLEVHEAIEAQKLEIDHPNVLVQMKKLMDVFTPTFALVPLK